jgi:hypothetical protein
MAGQLMRGGCTFLIGVAYRSNRAKATLAVCKTWPGTWVVFRVYIISVYICPMPVCASAPDTPYIWIKVPETGYTVGALGTIAPRMASCRKAGCGDHYGCLAGEGANVDAHMVRILVRKHLLEQRSLAQGQGLEHRFCPVPMQMPSSIAPRVPSRISVCDVSPLLR